jgi:hypothetical protein
MSACVICGAPVGAPPQIYAPPQAYAPPPQQDAYAPAPQGYGPPQGFAPLQAPPRPFYPPGATDNNYAIVSLVCGMLGLFPFWIGFILCICAIAFGVLGLQRSAQLPLERGKVPAIVGLVLGIIFILPASCGL